MFRNIGIQLPGFQTWLTLTNHINLDLLVKWSVPQFYNLENGYNTIILNQTVMIIKWVNICKMLQTKLQIRWYVLMFMMKIIIQGSENVKISVKTTYMGDDPKRWQSLYLSYYICVVGTALCTSHKPFMLFPVLCELQWLRTFISLTWFNNNNNKFQT